MLFKGILTSQVSGSMGGITGSHNASGQYFRARTIPVNPGSVEQEAIRQIFGQLTNRWINTLTEAQRQGWATYAANVSKTNALGDPIFVSGMNWYVGNNTARRQASLLRIDDAPSIFDVGDFTDILFGNAQAATNAVDIILDNTDDWANEDGAALLIFMSRPQNQTINFFKGPYQFAGLVDGDATTPPLNDQTIAAPFDFGVDQRVFTRVRVTRDDARLSQSVRDFVLTIA